MPTVIEQPDVTVLVSARASVGEGPHWNAELGALHWVDIPAGALYTSIPATNESPGRTSVVALPTTLGAAVPRRDGGFVAATGEGFAAVDTAGAWSTRVPLLGDGYRMNDAKCDPAGRLWAGSTAEDFTPGRGALHVLYPDWSTEVVLDGLTLPNGLGWSPDARRMYLADTYAHRVYAFDVDPVTAAVSRQRVLVDFTDTGDLPDGLCVDAAGHLWIAMWGGGRLLRCGPDGTIGIDLRVPVRQPSSCGFIGARLDRLCVTSALAGLTGRDARTPNGCVLAISGLPAPGLPVARFAG